MLSNIYNNTYFKNIISSMYNYLPTHTHDPEQSYSVISTLSSKKYPESSSPSTFSSSLALTTNSNCPHSLAINSIHHRILAIKGREKRVILDWLRAISRASIIRTQKISSSQTPPFPQTIIEAPATALELKEDSHSIT